MLSIFHYKWQMNTLCHTRENERLKCYFGVTDRFHFIVYVVETVPEEFEALTGWIVGLRFVFLKQNKDRRINASAVQLTLLVSEAFLGRSPTLETCWKFFLLHSQLPLGKVVSNNPCSVLCSPVAISTGKCVNLSAPRKSCFYFPLPIFDRWSFWGLSTLPLGALPRSTAKIMAINIFKIASQQHVRCCKSSPVRPSNGTWLIVVGQPPSPGAPGFPGG